MEQKLSREEKLRTAPLGRLLFELAVPAITAQIVNVLYNMVDRMYIGHIEGVGAAALTGVGVTLPILTLISAFAALASMGGAPRASILLGQGNKEDAERTLGGCACMLIVLSLLLTAAFQLFAEPLLMMFGASEATLPYALDYLRIYVCGTIFVQLALGLNSFITAQGFARTSMLTVLIGAALNIALDPLFIFVFDMGVKGAALATIISQAVSAVWVVRFLSGSGSILKLKPENLRILPKIVLPCLALGLSPFIMQSTESLIAICFNTSLQTYGGDLAVGAMTIFTSVMQFSMLPIVGLTQGAQPIISYNFGARNPKRVKKAFTLLLISCLVYSVTLWLCIMAFPQVFAGLFTNDEALIDLCRWAMRIYMGASFVMGAQLACQQTFIAIGNAKYSMFLAILRKIVLLIPLIYILPPFFADKVMSVFLSEPIADALAVATTVSLFTVQFRKTLKAMEEA